MEPVHATIELGHTNLEKARNFRDEGNQSMNIGNYREALRLFHQCILLARAVEQTSSVTIHLNSTIHIDTSNVSDSKSDDPEKQSTTEDQVLAEERAHQTTLSEDAKLEAHKIMCECYLNLANCVLNGGQRNSEDYLRVIQYCTNVLLYEPSIEQIDSATLFKGIAYMKAESYSEAIDTFQELPNNERARQLIEECIRLKAMKRQKRDQTIRANFEKQNNERNGFPPNRQNGINGH